MGTEIEADGRALRFSRRERALAQMEAHDLDMLVLGRQANVRYISGAPQLWVVGTRPFGPICEFVRATGEIHLNSTWDEGIPEEIPHQNLYGFAWNPMTLVGILQSIKGADTVRRVGTDALTPTFAKLLPMAFPHADLVDAEQAMQAARRIKTPEEVQALRRALVVAEEGLAAGVAALRPGIAEKALAGAVLEAEAAGGVSTPATQDAAWVTSKEHPWRRSDGDGLVREGDLVAMSAGVLADGYVAEVARTLYVGDPTDAVRALYRRRDDLWDRLLQACRPGAPVSSLLDAYGQAGEPLPAMPVAHGLGLGFDPPVVSPNLRATMEAERLEEGMVLAVTAYVWEQGLGGVFTRDAVLITADGAEILSTAPAYGESVHG
ncbi:MULTISPECIES: M24 family metallopeptidase [Mycolicibacterium]|uniref:Peptidase M24 n=2 Tax=Mycolicibacterium TaxID=1866885 RepID=A1TCV8_MYCVP|nr:MULTISPECIES: M24 family metallopeptidase [Mycolicibacterium]ABM15008.1 peptidase M24 [Mycolicibacterium vanbaalenii PYR-1]MCV7129898.1 aminopeptidase P family protein [Mycolicibacterium vanbaalenii PYR-1]MDN4518250.1 M24 family metallopeptidase [Mycolicibacterium austroafricanum]QRZ05347.1 aminopeptidase P family protein [Mycolicibacterium austroafricanum]QZT66910.1 M24 family metallopeptidase [Mycolicibacterium austroafricanum]